MPNPSRLAGRFLSVLISLVFTILLPPIVVAASGPTLCQITDTVYRADGTPAQGAIVIVWPAFTTSAGQPVTAGNLTVQLGSQGQFSAALAPNSGATPAGTYYRATYKLNDGTTNSEYWVVPATNNTTIGQIRSTLAPANMAAQFLTREFADSHYMDLADPQTIAGVKTFTSSPAVPTPVNPAEAANKSYVDANSGGSTNLASPPPIGNVAPNTVNATVATSQDARTANFPVMDLRDYGLVGDGTRLSSCSIAAGQATVTCPGAAFAASDVGKRAFFAGAGASGAYLNATVASVQSATQITLSASASTTVASGTLYYGTDNTAAWCAAMNCTSASVPNTIYSPQPGRTVRLPRGTYFLTGSAYSRNGDQLIGDGYTGTSVMLFDPTGQIHLLYMGSNASHGNNTGTIDGGGLENRVSGIFFATPEAGPGYCVDTNGYSGWDIDHNWFQCGVGIFVNNSNIGRVTANTCDSSTAQCMIFKGSGLNYVSDSTHSILVSDNLCYAPYYSCVQFDGASGVDFIHNVLDYAKVFSLYVFSSAGNTSYRINIADNIFTTSLGSGYYTPTQQHIAVLSPLLRSTIGPNNVFSESRDADIYVKNSGVVGLDIKGNSFYGGQQSCTGTCTASLQITAGTGIGIENNRWYSPGSYAADIQVPVNLSGNYCTSPFSVAPLPGSDYDKACFRFAASTASGLIARDNYTDSNAVAALAIRGGIATASTSGNRSAWPTADVYYDAGSGSFDSWNERLINYTLNYSLFSQSSNPQTGNASFAGSLSYQSVPGEEYHVSKYSSIQAAINAAYNNGTVLGAVVDDRTSPYTGPGFILYDSVTLKLAPTTYTINSTVTYNNSNNNVTAGIVSLPGARLIGASTSTNHGTIVTAANGLNADLIATSTVGTGAGASAQWWHWGGFENLRVIGNGANQTAGNCFNIENMGETAFLRTIEVSSCYLDNILFTGASATPSDIANITSNSAGRYGFNFDNLSGVAVVHGLSGDSNTTSLVRLNGGQSGTLTILGFKAEEEISGQDPLITIDETGQSGAQPSLFIIGGYTFGRSGVNDVIKYVNGTSGTTPFISVSNFYVQNYLNAVNDTVNNRTTAAANMNKVPFYYGPTGAFLSGQAYTLDLNTFVQSPHSGNNILTEIFGTTSSNETMVAASGTSSSIGIGGIGFRMPNRTTYGQSPELFAKMTYSFPGGVSNNQQWEFIPTKAAGDTSTRWIGDPSFRWDEIYSTDVNTNTATVGALSVTTCNGCGTGTRLVSGTLQGATSTLTGNSTDQTLYSATLPAGTFTVGSGAHCYAKWTHPTSSGSITYKWTLGTTTWAYTGYTSASQNLSADLEILAISSLSSQTVNLSPILAGTVIGVGGSYGNSSSENLANSDTLKLTFNAGSSDQIKGATFYCQTIQ